MHKTYENNKQTAKNARETVFKGNLLSSSMIEQRIIQAALTSIEKFNGTKNKFKAWKEAVNTIAQISGQNTIHIAFSKLIGSQLSTANMFKMRLQNLT